MTGLRRLGRNRVQHQGCRVFAQDARRVEESKPAVPLKGKNLVFAQPTLIAEIEFRGWTHDGSLLHASYKGLRQVQDNAAVFDMSERATL